jgi:hypothetical protein
MKSKEATVKMSHQFAARSRAGGNFGGLFLANSVTLTTKVQVDILGASAKQCINEGDTAFVNAYASRPVLTIQEKDASQQLVILTFAEAIARFGKGSKRKASRKPTGELVAHMEVNLNNIM